MMLMMQLDIIHTLHPIGYPRLIAANYYHIDNAIDAIDVIMLSSIVYRLALRPDKYLYI
jgi:hypothetical protein